MKILFAGTPSLAVPCLEILAKNKLVCGVLTNPDRPAGRKKRLTSSPVKEAAQKYNLEVFQPENLDSEFEKKIESMKPDLLVVIAFGTIFKKSFIDIFPLGGINIHPSSLPQYRGPSPITEAILQGDRETSITIQSLSMKMDQGDILLQRTLPITPTETVVTLTEKVAAKAPSLLLETVHDFSNIVKQRKPQDHTKATYCSLIKKEDGIINWEESAEMIDRKVRALNPWPKTVTFSKEEKYVILEGHPVNDSFPDIDSGENTPGKVLGVDKSAGILIQTGEGLFAVTRLQKVSKKPVDFKSFVNGQPDFIGTQLGER